MKGQPVGIAAFIPKSKGWGLLPRLVKEEDIYSISTIGNEEALRNETRRGLAVIQAGETLEGARRFISGRGRHGSFSDI